MAKPHGQRETTRSKEKNHKTQTIQQIRDSKKIAEDTKTETETESEEPEEESLNQIFGLGLVEFFRIFDDGIDAHKKSPLFRRKVIALLSIL